MNVNLFFTIVAYCFIGIFGFRLIGSLILVWYYEFSTTGKLELRLRGQQITSYNLTNNLIWLVVSIALLLSLQ